MLSVWEIYLSLKDFLKRSGFQIPTVTDIEIFPERPDRKMIFNNTAAEISPAFFQVQY